MTGRHNGTIKKENKNIYLKIMVSPPEQVSMEVFTKPGRALKCCNKSQGMESNHVICGL